MDNIKDLTLEELRAALQRWGFPVFHAQQIFSWIYQRGVENFGAMSNLPQALRQKLETDFIFWQSRIVKTLTSRDGTQKFLFELRDGSVIEAAAIPAPARLTGCVSTQVGCKFACGFCASGRAGFKRNLSVAEIMEQVVYLKDKSAHRPLTHLVFMGTGEPLDNYENLLKAIRMINSPQGVHIGARRITISTSGIVPGIRRLAGEGLQIELSVSLHAADDTLRSRIMPVNKKYPLKELMQACREYIRASGRQVTFEYILLKNVNSDLHNAAKLSTIIHGMNAKVNLIPCNPVQGYKAEPPGKLEILLFKDYLRKQGIAVTLRTPRGADIDAACGQLRLAYEKH